VSGELKVIIFGYTYTLLILADSKAGNLLDATGSTCMFKQFCYQGISLVGVRKCLNTDSWNTIFNQRAKRRATKYIYITVFPHDLLINKPRQQPTPTIGKRPPTFGTTIHTLSNYKDMMQTIVCISYFGRPDAL
jgi:hypothetical protein